jgi:hypothetical protein
MAAHQRPGAERVDRPAAHRREHEQVAAQRPAAEREPLPDDDVDTEHRERRAEPVQPADALLPIAALSSAMTTGVAASISELFATLVCASPPMKKNW